MDKKNNTLYNLIFPVWMLLLFPPVWLIVLPANYAVDLLVTRLAMKYLKIEDRKEKAKKVIVKVWIFGFLADIIGVMPMLAATVMHIDYSSGFGKWWNENIVRSINMNPFRSFEGILLTIFCITLAGMFIFIFNSKISFKSDDFTKYERKMLSAALAIFTAPYFLLVPTTLLYGYGI